MSVKWLSYVWDKTDYKEGELLTALALADFSDDAGYCYPYIETVAQKARLSTRQVQKILHRFEADGLLEITRHQGRGKRPEFQLKKVNSTTPFKDRKKVNWSSPIKEIKGELYDKKKVNSTTFSIYKEEPSLEPSVRERTPALISSNNFLAIYREFYPHSPLSIHQQEIIEHRVKNETAWRSALLYWSTNDYRPQSVGKICDKYDEIISQQALTNGHQKLPTPEEVEKQREETRKRDYKNAQVGL